MSERGEIIIYQTQDGLTSIDVKLDGETVWLTQSQMSELFQKDRTVIARHIQNVFREHELSESKVCAFFAHTTPHGAIKGKTQHSEVKIYNLDVIISVGYRVKSQRGVEFRRWANSVLKDYLVKGLAVNKTRLRQLGQTVELLKRASCQLDTNQVLSVIEQYTKALDLLDGYDHQSVGKPDGKTSGYVLTYEECRQLIDSMKFNSDNTLFGHEKDESFKGAIGNIYQTFGGAELYPSVEEKAANLLYFVVKDHAFSDGNKRIAATVFLYFLQKNDVLFKSTGEPSIDNNTLAAITIMIAESRMDEREMMVNLVMHFLL